MTNTDAIVARIMRIRNGMTVDADAEAIIRREIDALCGRISPETETLRRVFDRISTRLNDVLCEMKPDYNDSIVGFNEAWDIMRAVFKDELAKPGLAQTPAVLDRAWDQINALGGGQCQDNSYDQGIVDTVSKALDIIEELGGMDPKTRLTARLADAKAERTKAKFEVPDTSTGGNSK